MTGARRLCDGARVVGGDMRTGNIEITKQLLASFADRDVDAVVAFFDPAVQWTTAEDEPDHQTYHGHDGIRKLYSAWYEIWQSGFEASFVPEEFRAIEDDVIVPVRVQVRGRSSGVEVEIEETYCFKFTAGKISRVLEFRTKQEAFDAAGVRE